MSAEAADSSSDSVIIPLTRQNADGTIGTITTATTTTTTSAVSSGKKKDWKLWKQPRSYPFVRCDFCFFFFLAGKMLSPLEQS